MSTGATGLCVASRSIDSAEIRVVEVESTAMSLARNSSRMVASACASYAGEGSTEVGLRLDVVSGVLDVPAMDAEDDSGGNSGVRSASDECRRAVGKQQGKRMVRMRSIVTDVGAMMIVSRS